MQGAPAFKRARKMFFSQRWCCRAASGNCSGDEKGGRVTSLALPYSAFMAVVLHCTSYSLRRKSHDS
jgi:hypothetical protein